MTDFKLDPRLEADSIYIGDLRMCQVRLMKDARWPWLLLVPQRNELSELHQLSNEELEKVSQDIADCSKAMQKISNCESINTGALGNVVSQLHIHVIARNSGDPNWPNPVWGFGTRTDYSDAHQTKLLAALNKEIFNRT